MYGVCTQVQRGAVPALRISRKKGSFLRPLHVRDFVKEGYFCVPRYELFINSFMNTFQKTTSCVPSSLVLDKKTLVSVS